MLFPEKEDLDRVVHWVLSNSKERILIKLSTHYEIIDHEGEGKIEKEYFELWIRKCIKEVGGTMVADLFSLLKGNPKRRRKLVHADEKGGPSEGVA